MREWRIIKDANNVVKAQWKDSNAPAPKIWNTISDYDCPYPHENFGTVEKAEREILKIIADHKICEAYYKKSKQIKVLKQYKS